MQDPKGAGLGFAWSKPYRAGLCMQDPEGAGLQLLCDCLQSASNK